MHMPTCVQVSTFYIVQAARICAIYVCMCVCIYTCTHTHIIAYVYTCMHTCKHDVQMFSMHAYICARMQHVLSHDFMHTHT